MQEPNVIQEILFFLVPATVFGVLLGVSVFAGMFLAVFFALKRWTPVAYGDRETRDALDIVRERYARGEISRREYEQMREDLSRKGEEAAHKT